MSKIAFLWLAAILSACDVETIVAAKEGQRDAALMPDADTSSEQSCRKQADCEVGESCVKASCNAETGRCTPRPTVCGTSPDPVCGCDGITYFNDCLRLANGVDLAERGQCLFDERRCGGPIHERCPEGSYCALLLPPGPCPRDAPGRCWVVPTACADPPSPGDRFVNCREPSECMDACTAIRSEQPHVRASRCP